MVLAESLQSLRSEPDFYGRSDAIATMRRRLDGYDSLTIVQGDPGIGKTSLVNHVLGGYDRRIVGVEIESSDRWSVSRPFTLGVKRILGNPGSPEEFKSGLRRWYGEDVDRDDEHTRLLTAAVWNDHPFGEYKDAGNYTPERRNQGLGEALRKFIAEGKYEGEFSEGVAFQLSNWEREKLGQSYDADRLLNESSKGAEGKPFSYFVETRVPLPAEIMEVEGETLILSGVHDYDVDAQYRSLIGDPEGDIIQKIRNVAKGHPYALDHAILSSARLQDLPDDPKLEDLLDLSIGGLDANQKRLLQLVAHSQGPMSIDEVVKGVARLDIDDDSAYSSFEELVRKRLISASGNGYISVRNPRAAEHVQSSKHTTSEQATEYHGIHYDLSGERESIIDQFHHASLGKMVKETQSTAQMLIGNVPAAEAVRISDTAVGVLDEANTDGNEKLTRGAIDLLYNRAQWGLYLGLYEWDDVSQQIEIKRQGLNRKDPGLRWRDHSVKFVSSLAECDFESAAEYLELLYESAGMVTDFIGAGGVPDSEQAMMRQFAPKAVHLNAFLNVDRVTFDETLNDSERVDLLRDSAQAFRAQLSTDSNLGARDHSLLSYVLSTWSMFDPEESGLLEESHDQVGRALDLGAGPHVRLDALANEAQVLMLQGELDRARESISEARILYNRYSANRRTNIGLLLSERNIDKKSNISGTAAYLDEVTSMLEGASPPNYFNYPFWIKTQDRLLFS